MTLPRFRYHRAASLEEAVGLLAEYGDEARLLAGGHSLLPLMRLGRAAPSVLIDLGAVRLLMGVDDRGDHLRIGAMSRHHDLATAAALAANAPLLARAASLVGDPQVRNRGTIGGSLAHADPAGDLACAAMALDSTVMIAGPGGERTLPIGGLFQGPQRTVLAAGEVLTEIRVPKASARAWSYQRFSRRAQDWPTVAVAAVATDEGVRVALAGMGPVPIRASAVEAAWSAQGGPGAASLADEGCEPTSDLAASAGYRRHLARVLTRRALDEVAAGRPSS